MPAARKVLIVEDEAIFAANVKRFLEYHGWQACIAATGREAVEACSWFAPCVISLDYQLPDMNGFEALEAMRRHVSSPCVLVTAHPIEAIRCGIRAAGIARILFKPCGLDEIRGMLTQACLEHEAAAGVACGASR